MVEQKVVSDNALNAILNWVTAHHDKFGCGITWLTETRYGPVPGTTEEKNGLPDGHAAWVSSPWVAWFMLPTQVSRFRMVRAASAYEVKLLLIYSALGLTEMVQGDELLGAVDRKAAEKGLASPFHHTERVLVDLASSVQTRGAPSSARKKG